MLKELLLQKGWAGKTISRPETVDRLNPILEEFIRLNYSYDAGERSAHDARLASGIAEHQKSARADAGKVAETIFSCGGTAYNGTDLEPSQFDVGDDDATIISTLLEHEKKFAEVLAREDDIEHQMRTRAILSVVKKNSDLRLEFLREISRLLRSKRV